MARSTVVTVTSDLSGEELTDAVPQMLVIPVVLSDEDGTERLAYVKYGFDASDAEVIEFVKGMYSDDSDALLQNENVDSVEVGKKRNVTASANRSDEDLSAIREWAKNNGHEIAERGRIAQKVKDAYYAANKPA